MEPARRFEERLRRRRRRLARGLAAKVSRLDLRPRYHYTLSTSGRFVYVRVGKVATRTITQLIDSNPGLEARYLERCPLPPFAHQRYFVFGFVRNPWDRLVSCWRDKIVNQRPGIPHHLFPDPCSLQEFVEVIAGWDLRACNRHVQLQSTLLPPRLHFLGRFERLSDDIARLSQRLDLRAGEIPHLNPSGADPYPDYYTPALVDRVAGLYASDIERFGYRFEPRETP